LTVNFLDSTLVFEAQWLHRFPLLQLLLHDTAQKMENKSHMGIAHSIKWHSLEW